MDNHDERSDALLAPGYGALSDPAAHPSASSTSTTSSSSSPLSTFQHWSATRPRLALTALIFLILTIVFVLYFILTSLFSTPDTPQAAIITLPQGQISGLVVAPAAVVYYSIPFAQPPVGSLRWLPPQLPPPSWSGVRDGSVKPPMCVQWEGEKAVGAEDCLYLNVFVPRRSSVSLPPLPCLVYVHGGASLDGFSAADIYNHADLVNNRDIIAVTVNYRLNVFGYLALDVLSDRQATVTGHRSSGNYGLRDNIAALQWVKDNIANFGGDPNRVTIYGQSTGGTNVMALFVSPLARGLFQSAFSLSSSPVLRGSLASASLVNSDFVTNANCFPPILSCLLALSPSAALRAMPHRWLNSFDGGFPNHSYPDAAVIIIDGQVVPFELNEAFRAGVGSDVPLEFGHMGQEIDFGPMSNVTGMSQQHFGEWMDEELARLGWNETVVRELKAAYPIADYANDSQLTYEVMVNDITACGGVTNLVSLASSPSHRSPFYQHLIEFHPATPTPLLTPWPTSYAAHMWDLTLLLHTWPSYYQATEQDYRNAETLRRVWVDGMVKGGGTNREGSLWTPFGLEWKEKGVTYTARMEQEGGVDVLADLRWDKCQLVDRLGLLDFGWAN